MKLKDYLQINCKIERLTKFLNDNGEWMNEYIDENKDYIDPYYDFCEIGSIYYNNLDSNNNEFIKNYIEKNGIDFLFDNEIIEASITCGIYSLDNELWSYNLGEIEVQFSGLHDNDLKINCIYSELIKEMTEEEINEAKNESIYYVRDDCLYIDRSFDRISFILDEEKFNEFIESEKINLKEFFEISFKKEFNDFLDNNKNNELLDSFIELLSYNNIESIEIDEIKDQLNNIDDNGQLHEMIDSNIEIYNYQLREWAVDNYKYCERAVDEGLYSMENFDFHSFIQSGQYVYYSEMAYELLSQLKEILE